MWHHMATQIWDNIGTANGIAITWINVDLSLARCCSIHLRLQPHLTKGQECGNLFHIMTSSCSQFAVAIHHLYSAEKHNQIIIQQKNKSDVKHWNTLSYLDIGSLNEVFCPLCQNLVLLAWMSDELSHADWHTHTHTDAGNDNTRRPQLALDKNEALINVSMA